MTKGELWENFIKTGSVKDYLKYKKAEEKAFYDKDEDLLTEFSEEFFDESLKQDE